MKKIIIGVFLLALLATIVTVQGASAAASDYTADQAMAWVKGKVGTSVGYDDGSGYYQCVEFIQAYYEYLGESSPYGNGCDFASNELPDGWTRTAGGTPQKGDILVYSTSSVQQYGHVAIYESDNSIYDQDGSVWGATVKHETANYESYTYNYWGCIHPNFKSSSSGAPRANVLSGVYVIHSAWNYDICLDITGDSTENDANIQLYQRTYNDVQKFRIIRWDSDYYCINSIYNGRWLDAKTPIGDNSNVKLFNTNDADEDFWCFEDAGNGYVYIRNKTGYYLDVQGDQGVNHANVQLYHFVGNNSQKWKLEDVTDYYALPDGPYTVETAVNRNFVLDIKGNSTDVDANIQLYQKENSTVQLFRFIKNGAYYKVQSTYSNLWLDIKTPITNNSNVKLYNDNSSPENRWYLENASDGYVFIRSGADFYLDVQGDRAVNNANIQVYRFTGTNSQKWKLVYGQYTITYQKNTDDMVTDLPAAQSKAYGETCLISNMAPKRENYDFCGWAITASGSVVYQPGSNYTANESVTLYAIWKEQQTPVIEDILSLPADLTVIEEEAFAGVKDVAIEIPSSVTSIAANAFDSSVVIICAPGDYAETRCKELGLTVVTK